MDAYDTGISFGIDPSPHIFDPMKHKVSGKTVIKASKDFICVGISHASISGLHNVDGDMPFGNRDGITFVDLDKVVSMCINMHKNNIQLVSIDFDIIHDNCIYMARYSFSSDKSYSKKDILVSFDDLGDKFVFLFSDFAYIGKTLAFPTDKRKMTNVNPCGATGIVANMKKNILM